MCARDGRCSQRRPRRSRTWRSGIAEPFAAASRHNDPSAEHPSVLVTMGRHGGDRGTARPPRVAGRSVLHRYAVERAGAGRDGGGVALSEATRRHRHGVCGVRTAARRLCHRRRGGHADDARWRVRAGAADHCREWARGRSVCAPSRRCSRADLELQGSTTGFRRGGRNGCCRGRSGRRRPRIVILPAASGRRHGRAGLEQAALARAGGHDVG